MNLPPLLLLSGQQRGSITLITVFFTGIAAFLLLFGDQARSLQERVISKNDAATEEAFFAAEACLEESLLQLRTRADFSLSGPLTVGSSACEVTIIPTATDPGAGVVSSRGQHGQTVRTIAYEYDGAGGTSGRSNLAITHVLDASGSMEGDKDGCTNPSFKKRRHCEDAGFVWGPQPITSAKEAAKLFTTLLDNTHDWLGVVSFSQDALLHHPIDNNFLAARTAIDSIGLRGTTNIGAGLRLAREQFSALPPAEQGRNKVMILLTDGMPNVSDDPSRSPLEYAQYQASLAKADATLFIIGLGTAVREADLRPMASVDNSGNPFYFSARASDLDDIYRRIATSIVSYNLTTSNWREE